LRRSWKRTLLGTILSLCLAQADNAFARGPAHSSQPARITAPHSAGHAAQHRALSPPAPRPSAAAHRHLRAQMSKRTTRVATVRRNREQQGRASIYSRHFAGRRMADGGRFDPRSNSAASRTLPLGTRARVTNLHNGRSAIVRVRDRGPHTGGRILDVSPGIAERLGMAEAGIAPIRIVALSPVAEAAPAPVSRSRASPTRAAHKRTATDRRPSHGSPRRR